MMHAIRRFHRALPAAWLALVAAAALAASGCASSGNSAIPPGTLEPDRFLYERGMEALDNHKWLTAREYLTEVFETYSQSQYRPDAKLGIGDSYLGEGGPAALVSATGQFSEFLQFYPNHPRADYAQFKLGMSHFRQMRGPQRDQAETKSAIQEFETFIARFPNSSLMPDVRQNLRDAKDRLDEHEFDVGLFYYHIGWWPGAIDRFQALLKADPEYTERDQVYYYLGETLLKVGRPAEALPYFAKIVEEFEQSDRLDDAKKRVAELQTTASPAQQ